MLCELWAGASTERWNILRLGDLELSCIFFNCMVPVYIVLLSQNVYLLDTYINCIYLQSTRYDCLFLYLQMQWIVSVRHLGTSHVYDSLLRWVDDQRWGQNVSMQIKAGPLNSLWINKNLRFRVSSTTKKDDCPRRGVCLTLQCCDKWNDNTSIPVVDLMTSQRTNYIVANRSKTIFPAGGHWCRNAGIYSLFDRGSRHGETSHCLLLGNTIFPVQLFTGCWRRENSD